MPQHELELSGDTRVPTSLRTLWDGGGKLLTVLLTLAGLIVSGVRAYDRIGTVESRLDSEVRAREEALATLSTRVDRIETTSAAAVGLVREEIVGLRSDLQGTRTDLRVVVTHLNLTATRRTPIPTPAVEPPGALRRHP